MERVTNRFSGWVPVWRECGVRVMNQLDFVAETLLSGGDKKRTPNDLILFLIESIGNNNDVDGLNYQGVAEDLIKEYPKILEV